MRYLLPSIGAASLILGATLVAQNAGSGTGQQVPVGQTFKNFEFPLYQNGKLKATLTAAQATGITQNRAESTDLKIKLYDNGQTTTTITSPKADLFVVERKMRTKNTVLIMRADMEASAQSCDFDLTNKKYLLRTNVKVILKNFDISKGDVPAMVPTGTVSDAPAPAVGVATDGADMPQTASTLPPVARRSAKDDALPDSPSTNSALFPTPPKK